MSLRRDRSALHTQSSHARALRIDAHHHLWHFKESEFTWIDDSMAALRRNFLVDELTQELEAAVIDGSVAVQACESIEETRWLLDCARSSLAIWGVVGWAPLASDELPEILDSFGDNNKLVGFREIIQGKPDGYLERPEFNRGVDELGRRGLTYDLLIHARQLAEGSRFVDQHAEQRFVLDHAAKPRISLGELEPWATNLRELARRPNVFCKLSGLVTEADWESWTTDSLRPYLDVCVEAFGPRRLMAGSDWPVCQVASSYSRWWDVLAHYFAGFSESETRRIFGENAVDFYCLPMPSEAST